MKVFYRCHFSNRPFSQENAYSLPWGSENGKCGVCKGTGVIEEPYRSTCHSCGGAGGEDCHCDGGTARYFRTVSCRYCKGTGEAIPLRGYSCCRTPEGLSNYFFLRGGMHDSAPVVIFTGEEVGTGPDGEPLVVPAEFPRPRWITWGEMLDILVRRKEVKKCL